MSIKTYKQATWEAMKEEMLRDPSVYAMAEDIIGNGGSMGHYIGLGEAVGDCGKRRRRGLGGNASCH